MAELTPREVRHLRGLAHPLSPVAMIGKAGLTEAVTKDVSAKLEDHELIKVKIMADERAEFADLADTLAGETGATLVQSIGRIAVLYRAAKKPKISLSPTAEKPKKEEPKRGGKLLPRPGKRPAGRYAKKSASAGQKRSAAPRPSGRKAS